MKTLATALLILGSVNLFAQKVDTIYSNNQAIACNVKDVGENVVTYVYPGEDVTNSLSKNVIQKIVFKSGRVQTFAEATSYKTVNGVEDWENVTLTSVESEVKGLFKVGDVSAKARGTTTLSSMEKVKERANKKMKIVAAMMGANIVYLNQNTTTENHAGSKYEAGKATSTNLGGVAYSNKLPSYDDFVKLIGSKSSFLAFGKAELSGSDADYSSNKISKNVQVFKVYNESGLIMVTAKIDGVKNDTFRVITFSNEEFTLVWKDGDDIYNWYIKL